MRRQRSILHLRRPSCLLGVQGVRKYVDCGDLGADVVDGVEVTYLEYRLPDLAALDLLLQGKDVTVEFDGRPESR